MKNTSTQIIQLKAHARLHFGFFDLNGSLGRKFGSLGVSLQEPVTELQILASDEFCIMGDIDTKSHENIINCLQNLQKQLDFSLTCKINVLQLMPAHAGFGSGTQLALSLTSLVNTFCQLGLTQNQILQLSGRGARSGIGLGTFFYGGVIVDAGRGATTQVPPIVARADFPEAWRILLIFDKSLQGVHGAQELAAFKNLPEFPSELAEKLCHHVLMQALPALHEEDLPSFGKAVRALQLATGQQFAQAQGGLYASKNVAQVLDYLENAGVDCFGQSSWGPTGFAIFESEAAAQQILPELERLFNLKSSLKFVLTQAANKGVSITSNQHN